MSRDDLDSEAITVHVPAELPVLIGQSSRILLAILVELTNVELLDPAPEASNDHC